MGRADSYKKLRSGTSAQVKAAKAKLDELQKRQEILKKEVIKSLSGESAFDAAMLRGMIDETHSAITAAEYSLQELKSQQDREDDKIQMLRLKYREIINYANIFERLRGDARKMILAKIIERITIDRDYHMTINFYITQDEFEGVARNTGELSNSPREGICKLPDNQASISVDA